MNRQLASLIVALALVVVGVVFLLQNLGVLPGESSAVGGGLFAAGGLSLLWVFARDRERWWAAIPGCTLLGLAAVALAGRHLGVWSGSVFLGSIAVSFWLIYGAWREMWWALIPGGVLLTLAVVAGVPGQHSAPVLFLGLAVTFAVVALVPTAEGRQNWAWIPAAALTGAAGLVFFDLEGQLRLVWPAALIVAGAYIILRARTPRRR